MSTISTLNGSASFRLVTSTPNYVASSTNAVVSVSTVSIATATIFPSLSWEFSSMETTALIENMVNASMPNVSSTSTQMPLVEVPSSFNTAESALLIIGMALFSFITTGGNLCVFLAYYKNKELQVATNYFILSLAVADVTIGLVSINFFTVYLVYGYWPLGRPLCNFWLCVDYWCCQASVINLLAISVDRYLTVTMPHSYKIIRTGKRVKTVLVFIWILSFLLWVPWILSYSSIVGGNTVPEGYCYIQFIYDSVFMTYFTAIAAYYLPVTVMILLYIRVYVVLLKRLNAREALPANTMPATCVENDELTLSRIKQTETSSSGQDANPKSVAVHKKQPYNKDHSRATRLLVLIILAFAITWFPYDLFVVISPFCPTCISAVWWDFGYGLCYGNSFVNPFCYAFGNKKFKKTFKNILLRWRNNKVQPST